MCGATITIFEILNGFQGLSPRVRGNPYYDTSKRSKEGPIPACAGQPACNCCDVLNCGAYPRVCGATFALNAIINYGTGLSPRVRGNHKIAKAGIRRVGPIPACAGQPRH